MREVFLKNKGQLAWFLCVRYGRPDGCGPKAEFHTWTSWQSEILVQLPMRIKPRVPLHWQTAWDGVKAPGINVGTGAVIK